MEKLSDCIQRVSKELSMFKVEDAIKAVPLNLQEEIYKKIRKEHIKEDIEGVLEQYPEAVDIDTSLAVDFFINNHDCEGSYWDNIGAAINRAVTAKKAAKF